MLLGMCFCGEPPICTDKFLGVILASRTGDDNNVL